MNWFIKFIIGVLIIDAIYVAVMIRYGKSKDDIWNKEK